VLVTDPALVNAHPAEISDHLLDAGLTGVETSRAAEGVTITADQGDAAIEAALAGFVPVTTTAVESWRGSLPAAVQQHLSHLIDYRTSVRNGTQAAKTAAVRQAEAEHVIADVIDALRLVRSEFE
jgi:hypothetical protein